MKKKQHLLLLALLLWLVLLLALTWAEGNDPNASIRTFFDAWWYSVVTLTTVGYGDLYPVTAIGKVLGTVFVLLSTGLVAAVLSLAVSLTVGRTLPRFLLWLRRNASCHVFPFPCRSSAALACALSDRSLLTVCLGRREEWPDVPGAVFFDGSLGEILRHRTHHQTDLFCFGEDEAENYRTAAAFASEHVHAYAASAFSPDTTSPHISLFDEADACARHYWTHFPLPPQEQTVILIGCGRFGAALLERGLLCTVRQPELVTHWHVFGDDGSWQRRHPQLLRCGTLAGFGPGRDTLTFHDEPWDTDLSFMESAHRIVLCCDEESGNLSTLFALRRHCAVNAIHLRLGDTISGETVFGTQAQLLTADHVLHRQLDRRAMALHEIYRRSAGYPVPDWQEMSEFKRQSNIAAADHLATKARILLGQLPDGLTAASAQQAFNAFCRRTPEEATLFRQIEHTRWNRFHLLHNWHYDARRNDEKRRHPLLVTFEELSYEEQCKDDFAWNLLETLAANERGE